MYGLLRAAGVEVIGEVRQNLLEPDPDFYLGKSKLGALPEGADTIVADGPLSARQARNLFRETKLQPLDRTSVVLHIFAKNARSRKSKLQVEAAQLEHLRGQLRSRWPHLQRTGAGIGTRGPGETQLETDRRLLQRRLRHIRKELVRLDAQGERERSGRDGILRVALWGYTNSGKSTIAQALGGDARPSPDMFATLDSQTRRIALRTHTFLLTDTVGIIRDMPSSLLDAFRSTLEETRQCDLLLHVISGENWQEELETGRGLLEEIGIGDKPRLLVCNRPESSFPSEAILIEDDIAPLRYALEEDFRHRSQEKRFLFPYSKGGLLHNLYNQGLVLDRRDLQEGVQIRARILPEQSWIWSDYLL